MPPPSKLDFSKGILRLFQNFKCFWVSWDEKTVTFKNVAKTHPKIHPFCSHRHPSLIFLKFWWPPMQVEFSNIGNQACCRIWSKSGLAVASDGRFPKNSGKWDQNETSQGLTGTQLILLKK